MKKVLIVEDDKEMVELLEIHLRDLSCQIFKAYDGEDGLAKSLSENPDLIILDIMLPKMDGIEVCQKIRANKINSPILMLTAKSEEIDKVLGLEIGADDYLTKPFSVREFIARVKAIFRRTKMIKESLISDENLVLTIGDLTVDVDKRKVMVGNDRIELSPKEFELLVLLATNPGRSYNRSRLLNLIWGYDFEGYEHTVNSHINRLRAKIEPDMANPQYILTGRGNIAESQKHGKKVSLEVMEAQLDWLEDDLKQLLRDQEKIIDENVTQIIKKINTEKPMPDQVIKSILDRTKKLQEKAGYDGHYSNWVKKHLPLRLEDMLEK